MYNLIGFVTFGAVFRTCFFLPKLNNKKMDSQVLDSELDIAPPQYKDYAGFWQRFGAYFIDGLILAIVFLLVLGALGIDVLEFSKAIQKGEDPVALLGNKYYWASLINAGINCYYFAQQESSEHKATLGKRAVGIVVTDLLGHRLTFQQAAARALMKQAFTILAIAGSLMGFPDLAGSLGIMNLFGYGIQPFTAKKQAFHDLVAQTLVFRK
jgi:uncharacterized RDD family membrane protein YckC